MWYSEWTIYAFAISYNIVWMLRMAPVTKVGRAKTMKHGDCATEVALPVDGSETMLFTLLCSSSCGLKLALLADKVFLCCFLFLSEGRLTVDHAAKVNLLAVEALVECTRVHSKLE